MRATQYHLIIRILLILLAGGIISGGFYLLISNGSPAWQFGSTTFTQIQYFNQGFARLITGGEFAGGFGRRGLFGSGHINAGVIGIIRNLVFMTGITLVVVTLRHIWVRLFRSIRK